MSAASDIGFVFHERFLQNDPESAVVLAHPSRIRIWSQSRTLNILGEWGESRNCSTRPD
jgi:hypothetical protein